MKVLIVMFSFFASLVLATDWKHIPLKSEQGVNISIDYQIYEQSYVEVNFILRYAIHVWVNVYNVSPESKVRAVFINKYFSPNQPNQLVVANNVEMDLYFDGEKFTRQVKTFQGRSYAEFVYIYTSSVNEYRFYEQEIAIVVDGQWQKDPISQTNNFKFNLNQ